MPSNKSTTKSKTKEPEVDTRPSYEKSDKDPQPVIDYIFSRIDKPKNLERIETYNYCWENGKDNRWRVNIITKEMVKTRAGNMVEQYVISRSFFLHFDYSKKEATYCNPSLS